MRDTGFLETAITIVYPRHCPVCDKVVKSVEFAHGRVTSGRLIHDECNRKVRRIKGNTCVKCGKPLDVAEQDEEYCRYCRRIRHQFDRGFSVFEYRSISGSIYRFKYMGRQEYATFMQKKQKDCLVRSF